MSEYDILKSLEGQDLGLDGSQAPQSTGGAVYSPYLEGRNLRGLRLFPFGKSFQKGNDYKLSSPALHTTIFDDFMVADFTKDEFWLTTKGTDTAQTALTVASNGGVLRLTTAANAAHTVAANGIQVDQSSLGLSFKATNTGLVAEFRMGNASSLLGLQLFFGFTNAGGVLQLPISNTADVLTAAAANCAGFLFDANATTLQVWAVGAKASVCQGIAVGIAPTIVAATYNTYRLEIDATGNASFFVDGVLVKTASVGMTFASLITAGTPLTPVMIASSTLTAAKSVDFDYVYAQQLRV